MNIEQLIQIGKSQGDYPSNNIDVNQGNNGVNINGNGNIVQINYGNKKGTKRYEASEPDPHDCLCDNIQYNTGEFCYEYCPDCAESGAKYDTGSMWYSFPLGWMVVTLPVVIAFAPFGAMRRGTNMLVSDDTPLLENKFNSTVKTVKKANDRLDSAVVGYQKSKQEVDPTQFILDEIAKLDKHSKTHTPEKESPKIQKNPLSSSSKTKASCKESYNMTDKDLAIWGDITARASKRNEVNSVLNGMRRK